MVKSHDQLKGAFREFLANLRCAQQAVWSNDFLDFSCMTKPMTYTNKKGWKKIKQKHSKLKTDLFFFGYCSGFIWSILSLNSQPVFFDVNPPKNVNRFDDVDCWVHSFCRWIGWTVNIDDSSSSEAPETIFSDSVDPTLSFWGWRKTLGNPEGIPTKDWGNLNGTLGKLRGESPTPRP